MSTDHYARLERQRGPQPPEQMAASIAQGPRLSLDERAPLLRPAGHHRPVRGSAGEHVGPGLPRILGRLADTPAEVVTELGETLRQTPLGVALTGDSTRFTGPDAASATAGSPCRPPARSTRPRTTPCSPACSRPGCARPSP